MACIFKFDAVGWICNDRPNIRAAYNERHVIIATTVPAQQPMLADLPQLPRGGLPFLLQLRRPVNLGLRSVAFPVHRDRQHRVKLSLREAHAIQIVEAVQHRR